MEMKNVINHASTLCNPHRWYSLRVLKTDEHNFNIHLSYWKNPFEVLSLSPLRTLVYW
ncbi:hypothetical protein [Prevotella nigrescens]|uniref:hypothetical protein n=1 Tax=Prevotella nigrescens TaxID=28133 RepID=UPI00241C4911|nr:hypothetical protein [Prevotella nigrescens]